MREDKQTSLPSKVDSVLIMIKQNQRYKHKCPDMQTSHSPVSVQRFDNFIAKYNRMCPNAETGAETSPIDNYIFFFFKFHLCCYTLQDKNSQKMITRTTQLHRISAELNNNSTTGWEEELNLGDCQPVEWRVRAYVRGQTASVQAGCRKETQAQTRSHTQISLFAFLILGNGEEYFRRNY